MQGARTSVLDEDRSLGEAIPESRREAARLASTAGTVVLGAGGWRPAGDADHARGGYGLLILDGLMIRRVGFAGRYAAEVLSAGDLLRPWEFDGDAGGVLPLESTWRVLNPARLGVLDFAWAGRLSQFPQIGTELAGRALARSRRLAALMAIVQLPRLDDRLWLLFWELADRFGRVHADGVHLDLPLTHELLSHLAAARRPSVSGALTRLAQAGRLRREGRSWILVGEPPAVEPAGSAATSAVFPY